MSLEESSFSDMNCTSRALLDLQLVWQQWWALDLLPSSFQTKTLNPDFLVVITMYLELPLLLCCLKLQGNRAIAEIQFADYIFPAFDQARVLSFCISTTTNLHLFDKCLL